MLRIDYIVNRFYNSMTYILSKDNSDKVFLVDCGDVEKILKKIGGKRVVGVLLTHTHADHIYGISELLISFPEAIIYINEFGYKALASPKLNISRYHGEFDDISIEDRTNVRIISEKSCLNILGHEVGVYETPGHDPSCLTYKIEGYLFTGDSYIPGEKVFTKFPNSDKSQASKSERQILKMSEGLVVCPGHEV